MGGKNFIWEQWVFITFQNYYFFYKTLSYWETQIHFMFETRLKKKRVWIRTYSRNISHTHTNTPFLYLLWNKLSHLVRGPTFEQEASKQSRKNRARQWYIVVFGCRYSNRAWDLLRCRFCLTLYTFHLKSERWDVSMCQAWNWMHACFHFGGRDKTWHSASCYVPARHCETYIFFHTDFLL